MTALSIIKITRGLLLMGAVLVLSSIGFANSSWSPKYPKAGLQYDSNVQLSNRTKTGSQHATFDIAVNLSHPIGGGTWTF